MSEMINRVAKAIEAKNQSLTNAELSRKWEMFAAAAIEAMREPTQEMEKAFIQQGYKRANFSLEFAAAIDAALN